MRNGAFACAAVSAPLAACAAIWGIHDRSLDTEAGADASALVAEGAAPPDSIANGDAATDGNLPLGDATVSDAIAMDAAMPPDALDAACAADTSSDPRNCGACNHDCLDGGCVTGQCQPITLATVSLAQSIASDDTSVYIANLGSNLGDASVGTIDVCSVGGCNESPTPIAQNQFHPVALAVDSASVFWLDQGTIPVYTDGALVQCSKTACAPATLSSGEASGNSINASDPENLFWTTDLPGRIRYCKKSSCSATTWANETSPFSIAVDAVNVYWGSGGKIRYCPLPSLSASCSPQDFYAGSPMGIAADSSGVYWTSTSTVSTCPATGCPGGTPTSLSTSESGATAIALDPTAVYWVDATRVRRVAKSGGASAQTLAMSGGVPVVVAVDDAAVYWLSDNGVIQRVAK